MTSLLSLEHVTLFLSSISGYRGAVVALLFWEKCIKYELAKLMQQLIFAAAVRKELENLCNIIRG